MKHIKYIIKLSIRVKLMTHKLILILIISNFLHFYGICQSMDDLGNCPLFDLEDLKEFEISGFKINNSGKIFSLSDEDRLKIRNGIGANKNWNLTAEAISGVGTNCTYKLQLNEKSYLAQAAAAAYNIQANTISIKEIGAANTPSPSTSDPKIFANIILPYLYRNDLDKFSKIIYSDLKDPETRQNENMLHCKSKRECPLKMVIYNQKGYEEGIADFPLENSVVKIGKPLFLKAGNYKGIKITEDIPIGYNIHLPNLPIKGVLVHVYGGFETAKRLSNLYKPMSLSPLDIYLLSQGIAVITLNLVDFLKLEGAQRQMSSQLQDELQASIDKFFEVLRNSPGQLFDGFFIPEQARIFLFGASFGGRTAIRQAELYPNSFDGYISHDGAISGIMSAKSDLRDRGEYKDYLSPMDMNKGNRQGTIDSKISKIVRPILLLHNFDDNNVNVKVTLDFYWAALLSGKKDLVHLFITRRGNPISSSCLLPNREKLINKGHFCPSEETQAFRSYSQTISSFILGDLTISPQESKWMAHQFTLLANKNYKEATLEELFLSEAFRIYVDLHGQENLSEMAVQKTIDSEWEDIYVPLYKTLKYLTSLSRSRINLYEEISYILNPNVLKDKDIQHSIKRQLPFFTEYVHEQYGYDIPDEAEMGGILNSKNFIETYRSILKNYKNYSPDTILFLLSNIYLGNIEFYLGRREKIEENLGNHEELRNNMDAAKLNLIRALQKNKKLFTKGEGPYENSFEEFKQMINQKSNEVFSEFKNILNGGTIIEHDEGSQMEIYNKIIKTTNNIFSKGSDIAVKYQIQVIDIYAENVKRSEGLLSPTYGRLMLFYYTQIKLSLALIKGEMSNVLLTFESLIKAWDSPLLWKSNQDFIKHRYDSERFDVIHSFLKNITENLVSSFPSSKFNRRQIDIFLNNCITRRKFEDSIDLMKFLIMSPQKDVGDYIGDIKKLLQEISPIFMSNDPVSKKYQNDIISLYNKTINSMEPKFKNRDEAMKFMIFLEVFALVEGTEEAMETAMKRSIAVMEPYPEPNPQMVFFDVMLKKIIPSFLGLFPSKLTMSNISKIGDKVLNDSEMDKEWQLLEK